MTKVLITGARGQLGQALLQSRPRWANVKAVSTSDVDLVDEARLSEFIAAERPDILINTAAYTMVDQAEREEALAFAVNAKAVKTMSNAMQGVGGKLIHISTDFVFDGSSARAYRPNDQRGPINVYGRSKAAGEDYLQSSDLLVRTSWLYAPAGTNFVRTMIRMMEERRELKVVADQFGCPTLAEGLAETLWGLTELGVHGKFHYCDGGSTNWYEFAVAIAEECQKLGKITDQPVINPIRASEYVSQAKRPAVSMLDCSETWALLGRKAPHWRSNLRRMLLG